MPVDYTPAQIGKIEFDANNEQIKQILIQIREEIKSLETRIKNLESKTGG